MTRHAQNRLAQRFLFTIHTKTIFKAIRDGRATQVIDRQPPRQSGEKWHIVSIKGEPLLVLTIDKFVITILPRRASLRILDGVDSRFYIPRKPTTD